MKKTLVFLASALFVALMAVSCNDKPAEATEEDQNAEATVEEVTEEAPAAEAAAPAATNDVVNFDQYLDEYEKFVKSYEEFVDNGGIDKAKEVKTNAEAAKAKIKEDNLNDAQLARFKALNERMTNASVKLAQKTAEGTKDAVNAGKDAADKLKGLGKKN
ncbi:MAG: hypothetical protein II815_12050 [Bacteroidales bacterium]|jgi:hypothetical protein|nr:hypothetical protein [Bacteroidales bacterium]MBR3797871.1 hypothetical protein [Bacteroidales bacterium]